MKRWETKNGIHIFQVLSGRSNSYLIVEDELSYLVDTGKESAYIKLLRNIDSLNFNIKNLSFLFLTHTHYDHCQSVKRIKDESNCNIIVSEKALDSIKYGYTKLPNGTKLTTKLIAKLGQAIGKRKYGYKSFAPDIFIKADKNLEKEGNEIEILETPGHSKDSISIIVNNEIAIVGDVMFGVFQNSVFPPYSDDVKTMIESWGKLLKTDCKIFLPGHGKEINRTLLQKEFDRYERKHNNP